MFENAVTYQYIGNVTNAATDDTTLGKDIAVGSVALVEVASNKVQESDQTSTTGLFRIAQKTAGGQLIYSPEFEMAKATISSTVYAAAAEQVSYWGYNGTAGDLGTIVSGNDYILHISLLNYAPGVGTTPLIKTIPYTATAATEYNVALGLAQSFDRVFSREPNKVIEVEIVSDEAGTDLSATTGNITVVKGSKYITAATDIDGEMAVGDWFRDGTAVTDAVYRVTAINTATEVATLDRAYQGASATLTSTATNFIASVAGLAGSYGLKFTGIDRFAASGFDPVVDFYSKTRFSISSDDFDTDVVETESTTASEGSGTAYEVAQLENYCAKNEGLGLRLSAYPPTKTRTEADLTTPGTYDTMVIEAYNNNMVDVATGIQPISKFKIVIRTKVALNGDDVDTALAVTV